tara:strand:- start:13845 stop:14060 length:216 start_codon:yes stop_codon:yes gene_type:complete
VKKDKNLTSESLGKMIQRGGKGPMTLNYRGPNKQSLGNMSLGDVVNLNTNNSNGIKQRKPVKVSRAFKEKP